jgi:hypothetical protein
VGQPHVALTFAPEVFAEVLRRVAPDASSDQRPAHRAS